MSNKNLLFFLLAMLAFQMPLQAQGFGFLTIAKTSGESTSYAIGNVKIAFNATAGTMDVTSESGTATFSLAGLEKLHFTSTNVGMRKVTTHPVTFSNGDRLSLTVTAAATLRVYSTDGTLVLQKQLAAGSNEVSMSQLPMGTYIVKLNGSTLKISKQ